MIAIVYASRVWPDDGGNSASKNFASSERSRKEDGPVRLVQHNGNCLGDLSRLTRALSR